jgi:hypothetical protein
MFTKYSKCVNSHLNEISETNVYAMIRLKGLPLAACVEDAL